MKLGNYEIKDWYQTKYTGPDTWSRICVDSNNGYHTVSIYLTRRSNIWKISFLGQLRFLANIWDIELSTNVEEAKMQVENFLNKMAGLCAFV